ncbi:MAG: SAM-dependent methyltransferase, partial [Pseudomonas sp.]
MPAKGVDSCVLTGEALLARFTALDAFLIEHQALWKPRPFTHLQLPWEASYPELALWLRGRSLEDAESSHNQPCLLDAPEPFASLAAMSADLSTVCELPARTLEAAGHRLNVDVPGRKWQQIEAFAGRLQFAHAPTHWLDWCSGKGHLGRR